jgi:hypothetical protein
MEAYERWRRPGLIEDWPGLAWVSHGQPGLNRFSQDELGVARTYREWPKPARDWNAREQEVRICSRSKHLWNLAEPACSRSSKPYRQMPTTLKQRGDEQTGSE